MKWLSVARCNAIEVPMPMQHYFEKWIDDVTSRNECNVYAQGVVMAFEEFEYDYFEKLPRAARVTIEMFMNEEARFALAAKYAE